jgi:hypothetical protein
MGFPPVTNAWIAQLGDEDIVVYGGSRRDESTEGLVIVLQKNRRTGAATGPDTYDTPAKAGEVEIVDAVGERLTLQANDGTLFYFDVLTRQWVTPGPTPVPSSLPPTP